ncbi:hypothetical protein CROQUDRAFT_43180 [Cronartium quercuum f. sp. fusiforme G11]|uniref:Uncharacterized protein n=1 Tax=Cronartium quercuum f. sp. fusiforme G11 TaxID=708437 RepID=A0A9P6NN66_9BASI|nr:hypothetical protein CROQUDRAFT_43180 [Cronartium quercuum f. sp. fusiforme G11]
MIWWGPLLSLSEFSGERLIGTLQKMNTNGKMHEMAETLIKQFGQLQRLKRQCPLKEVAPHAQEKGLLEVDSETYQALLIYYQEKDSSWRDYRLVPHPKDLQVLGGYVKERCETKTPGGVRLSKWAPNNLIEYIDGDSVGWGEVTHLFEVLMEEGYKEVVLVWVMKMVDNPCVQKVLARIQSVQVERLGVHVFISLEDVVATHAY